MGGTKGGDDYFSFITNGQESPVEKLTLRPEGSKNWWKAFIQKE